MANNHESNPQDPELAQEARRQSLQVSKDPSEEEDLDWNVKVYDIRDWIWEQDKRLQEPTKENKTGRPVLEPGLPVVPHADIPEVGPYDPEGRHALQNVLLENIKANMSILEDLYEYVNQHSGAEDAFYRYYHQSHKVYRIQDRTERIVETLSAIMPGRKLNRLFMQIVREGTGKEFHFSQNKAWKTYVGPVMEAFFHAREFLKLMIKYGQELDDSPEMLPFGWAAVLTLYNLR